MKTKALIASAALASMLALPSLASAHSSHSHDFGSKFSSNSFKTPMMDDHHHHHSAFRWTVYPQMFIPQGCGWLKARAIDTGSPYWWDRYRACKGY